MLYLYGSSNLWRFLVIEDTLEVEQEKSTHINFIDATMKNDDEIVVVSTTIPKKKGRKVVHPLAGRIVLLREEVQQALENSDAFIEAMQLAHHLDEARRAQLIVSGHIHPTVDEMYYTFKGPIQLVIDEMLAVQEKYQKRIESGQASIRFDFHKVKTMNDPTKKKNATSEELDLYVPPVVQKINHDHVILQVEAHPDMIYGYVKVILNKTIESQPGESEDTTTSSSLSSNHHHPQPLDATPVLC